MALIDIQRLAIAPLSVLYTRRVVMQLPQMSIVWASKRGSASARQTATASSYS